MIRKFLACFFIVPLMCILPACKHEKKEAPLTGLHVINVLDKDLYDDCHIAGSENVLLENVDQFAQKLAKDSEIVVYCSNFRCTASGMVAKQLKAQGFTKVYAYEAGMAEWYQEKLPVTGLCTQSYLNKVIPEPSEHDENVAVISTKELYAKMKEAGLL
jgi:rhodanese-related sulfurtransferase